MDSGTENANPQENIEISETKRRRTLKGPAGYIAAALAIGLAIFQLWTAYFGPLGAIPQRTIHLTVLLVLVFMFFPARKGGAGKGITLLDIICILGSVLVGSYIYFQYDKMMMMMNPLTAVDIAFGIAAVVLVLEGTRRVIGMALPIIAIAFLIYAFAGKYMPGLISHVGYNLERVAYQMYFTTEGLFGMPIGISATYVAAFILFGAFLKVTGGGDAIIEIVNSLFGHVRGGPAKIAVVASSLFGTISGSSVANVVGTGAFTIPMMKKAGYKPEFAGAVEAAASTGGQLAPPVMGAAAFLICEVLGMPYIGVVVAAVFPAVFYYLSLFLRVDLRAAERGLKGLPIAERPPFWPTVAKSWQFSLPVVVLLYILGVVAGSPTRAAFLAIVALIVVSFFRKDTRITWKKVYNALQDSVFGMIEVAIASAAAGVLIGVITLTGLGVRLSSIMIQLSGGNLPILLILTMVAALILGMGVPATPAYIIVSALLAPAIIQLGATPLAAHLFVFYFAMLSMVTPPVAVAAYAGASLAGANPMKTGYTAFGLCLPGFIMPFIYIYNPGLLLQGPFSGILFALAIGLYVTVALAVAVAGYGLTKLHLMERVALIIGAILLVEIHLVTTVIGFALITLTAVYHVYRARKNGGRMLPAGAI